MATAPLAAASGRFPSFHAVTGSPPAEDKFVVMIDAGSSHSHLFVYRYQSINSTAMQDDQLAVAEVAASQEQKPGISSFATTDPSKAGASLDALLAFAKQNIPDGVNVADVPIYLGATAGLRIITLAQRDAIMASVRQTLKQSGFLFKDDQQARTLAGEEEGVFGWITVNQLLGTLTLGEPTRTFGALDMGGESTQLTFHPTTDILSNLYRLQMDAYAAQYHLYTHSFLRFGANGMYDRVAAAVVKAAGAGHAVVMHPCLPKGFSVKYSDTVRFNGTSDFAACMPFITALLDLNTECFAEPCSINGVYQPPAAGDFYLFSAFAYDLNVINPHFGLPPENMTVADVVQAAQKVCPLTMSELEQAYTEKNIEYSPYYCIHSIYYSQLLSKGYKFDNDQRLHVANKINGGSAGWALGAVLFEINNQAPKPIVDVVVVRTDVPESCKTPWRVAGFAFALAIIAFAALGFMFQVSRKQRAAHRRMIANAGDSTGPDYTRMP